VWQGFMNIIMDASFQFLTAVYLQVQLFYYEMLCRGVNSYRRFEDSTVRNVGNCSTE
jgi:hypothetical protein